jgi:hypothetical protein
VRRSSHTPSLDRAYLPPVEEVGDVESPLSRRPAPLGLQAVRLCSALFDYVEHKNTSDINDVPLVQLCSTFPAQVRGEGRQGAGAFHSLFPVVFLLLK